MKSFPKVHRFVATSSASTFLIFITLTIGCTNPSLATGQQQPKPATTERSNLQTNVASNPPRCQTEQLSVRRVSGDAGVGNVAIIYAFTNNGSSPCNLYGYPGFALLNSKNQPLKGVNVIRSQSTYFLSKQSPQRVTLAPGGQASFEIAYNHTRSTGQSCPTSVKVQITPPNAYHHFTLPAKIDACTGKVRVTPVRAGIIQ
ncbi:DUF4232 domain-containing protein [uncultured Nostoc sp.]|uniref:DUF4232 domain-containing protein n=1 Tax=uncultured Nostoc sp. TaxID=340711 RepID=UPI0035CC76F8